MIRRPGSQRCGSAHRVLAQIDFEVAPLAKGYANRTLRVDLDTNAITIHPVTEQMKELWVGGKGFDLWLMMQEINKDTRWDSRENPICMSPGPLGGTASFPGSGKTLRHHGLAARPTSSSTRTWAATSGPT